MAKKGKRVRRPTESQALLINESRRATRDEPRYMTRREWSAWQKQDAFQVWQIACLMVGYLPPATYERFQEQYQAIPAIKACLDVVTRSVRSGNLKPLDTHNCPQGVQ